MLGRIIRIRSSLLLKSIGIVEDASLPWPSLVKFSVHECFVRVSTIDGREILACMWLYYVRSKENASGIIHIGSSHELKHQAKLQDLQGSQRWARNALELIGCIMGWFSGVLGTTKQHATTIEVWFEDCRTHSLCEYPRLDTSDNLSEKAFWVFGVFLKILL